MELEYNKITHLGFIQSTIERMAKNSLSCKTFALTLFSILSTVFFNAGNYITLTYWGTASIMLLSFWFLDAWYLRQERLFRRLYDFVRLSDTETLSPYDMSTEQFNCQESFVLRIMFSRSVWPVYLFLVVAVVLMSIYAFNFWGK